MSCTKITNSFSKKSNEFILVFKVNETASEVLPQLRKWLFQCLDILSHKVMDFQNHPAWRIIFRVYKKHLIFAAIHLHDNDYSPLLINLELTINYNIPEPRHQLLVADIEKCLIDIPKFIEHIGISAVSSDVMMKWWEQMISKSNEKFEGDGRGFMVHPMFQTLNDDKGWFDVREQSFNFGWKGYNPQKEK